MIQASEQQGWELEQKVRNSRIMMALNTFRDLSEIFNEVPSEVIGHGFKTIVQQLFDELSQINGLGPLTHIEMPSGFLLDRDGKKTKQEESDAISENTLTQANIEVIKANQQI